MAASKSRLLSYSRNLNSNLSSSWYIPGSFSGSKSKVAVDVLACIIILIVLAPLLIIVSAAVAFDGGPVFYMHERIGRGSRRFNCLKFRSMVMDSDQVLARYLENNEQACAEWRQTQKLTNDPRITRIGRFLRATSIDELPQLFNVLRLEMSLVGPRPIVESEIPRYGRSISYYLRTRPGLTGLWQVSGRSNTSYSRRVALDAWYVKNWAPWLDAVILLRTVVVVLRRDGAR